MMSLKAAAGSYVLLSFNATNKEARNGSSLKGFQRKIGNCSVAMAATNGSEETTLTSVLFQPFEEVQLPSDPQESLARHNYIDECEAAINELINVRYNVSCVHHALFVYFDHVAPKLLAKFFFKKLSEEERELAGTLMEYQNKRGGKVKLHSIVTPVSEFDHAEKGDALYAMELALSLAKLVNEKLLNLHAVANVHNDPEMAEFVKSELLSPQVDTIKMISKYVAQLRRVGKGHGTIVNHYLFWH